MAVAGRRAVALLNGTDAAAQVNLDWEKLGLKGAPRSARDVWSGKDLGSADAAVPVAAHDLVLLVVDGEDKAPVEYAAKEVEINGMQSTRGPTFARLQYANTSGHVVVVPVKSTSGLSTALALPPTVGSAVGVVGLILPHGTADLSFDGQTVAIRGLDVYSWR